jgi:PAS domain S-box-containing protein
MHETITHEPSIMDGGEMGEMIRAYDWQNTSLGPPQQWPQSLKTCIRIMLTSSQPIWIGWGQELIKFYNDPYKAIVGGKHPWALGKPASVVWKDIWHDIQPMLDKVMHHNQGTFVESQLLIMERNGYPEETYYTFSYTPIPGDKGETAGMFCANSDDTYKIITERQLKTLTELGKTLANAATRDEVVQESISILSQNPYDFPFAVFRTLAGEKAMLAGSTPLGEAESIVLKEIDLQQENRFSVILNKAITEKKFQMVENVRERFGHLPKGAWPVCPDKLLVLPIIPTGTTEPYGLLILGVNPYRLVDEKYLGFYTLVADQIATSLSQVQALEEERKRAEALSEIDKAKTVFFSNISHEFRTPITLMLGTIEEALQDSRTLPENRQRMDVAHRNAMRLLKLVNNLLDFSRIESGKTRASFQLTDIAQFTAELASGFESALATAGLGFTMDIPPGISPVYIDRNMWEKIVLNLLSNAFKYTLEGSVAIALAEQGDKVILTVTDTGVGIPADEIPKMFQRFHRVQQVTGRTHEGTGIGLSLIYELIQLQFGEIKVASEVGKGSVFTVIMRTGKEHLPPEQVTEGSQDYQARLTDMFLEEAASIIKADTTEAPGAASATTVPQEAATILVVDDNPDMRSYLQQILSKHFHILTANNGEAALEIMQEVQPNLVLTDIMMPVMDGAELLTRIKAESRWQHIPVLLLSARAGEEARIEGYETGADDYLVKPFSSKELLSRIQSHLRLSEQRQVEKNRLKQLLRQAPVAMCLLRGRDLVVEVANDRMLELWGKSATEVLGKPLFEGLADAKNQGFEKLLDDVYVKGESFVGDEVPITLLRNGITETIYVNFVYEPVYEYDNSISGVVAVGTEVTEQLLAREKLEMLVQQRTSELQRSNEDLLQFAHVASHDLKEPVRKIRTFANRLEHEVNTSLSEKGKEYLGKIYSASSRMNYMIDGVLSYSTINQIEQTFSQVNLHDIIRAIEVDLEVSLQQQNAKIVCEPIPVIDGAPVLLYQLFYNLVNNSLKFCKKDQACVITIASKILEDKDKGFVEISVSDNGIGFKQIHAERIFQTFSRLHPKDQYEGTGLGLALCKKIVERHHGTISAIGSEGEGATFLIKLPLKQ